MSFYDRTTYIRNFYARLTRRADNSAMYNSSKRKLFVDHQLYMFGCATFRRIALFLSLAYTTVYASYEVRLPRQADVDMGILEERSKDVTEFKDVSSFYDSKNRKAMKEGERHGDNPMPDDAQLISLPLKQDDSKVAVYWSKNADDKSTTHAFVMVHGKLRDGFHYWNIMNNAWKSALKDNYGSVSKNTIIVAPEFYSKRLNKGQYLSLIHI